MSDEPKSDVRRWLNVWKILRSIDQGELIAAGLPEFRDTETWRAFCDNPPARLAISDEETWAKIWSVVIARGG